jgi:hypothetical protein
LAHSFVLLLEAFPSSDDGVNTKWGEVGR